MASPLIVHISRRILRQLQLGKGMFFDAEMMDELAACGIWDLAHQKAAELQKAEADRRRQEREEQREAAREGHGGARSRRGVFGRSIRPSQRGAVAADADDQDLEGDLRKERAREDVNQVIARVRRNLRMPPRHSSVSAHDEVQQSSERTHSKSKSNVVELASRKA